MCRRIAALTLALGMLAACSSDASPTKNTGLTSITGPAVANSAPAEANSTP